MMLSQLSHMGNSNHRRRHKQFRDMMAFLTFSGLLAGCNATAKNERPKSPKPPEASKLTAEGCAIIKVQSDMIECFEKLKGQQDAEIAKKKEELSRINADVKVLSKEAQEAMERLEDRVLEPER